MTASPRIEDMLFPTTDDLKKTIAELRQENEGLSESVKLDEANVPREGRWVVVPPWFHGRLLLDGRFVKASESADATALRNAYIGRAAGFDVMTSNNAVLVTGDDHAVMAGTDMAISYAEQISQVEAYRDPNSFADIIRGLHLWGARVLRPEGLASAVVSQT